MGKFFLHIGLPKTATTTLQYEVLSHEANREIYLGKFSGNPGPFHKLISGYLDGIETLETTRAQMRRMIGNRPVALYSNEMLTVGSTISWREKIAKLGTLFLGQDCTVLVTLRNPHIHAPSLYAELKPTSGWRDFNAFLDDPQSDLLDPAVLNQVLLDAGFGPQSHLCYIEFDTLISSQFTVLKRTIPGLFIPDRPQERNARVRRDGAIVSREIGVNDKVFAIAKRLGLLPFVPMRLRKSVGALLRHAPISWNETIDTPSNHATLAALEKRYEVALTELRSLKEV